MSFAEESTNSFIVSEEEAGQRLDKLLCAHFPGHSRTYFQFLIEEGYVLVNQESWKKREKPCAGDEIDVCFLYTPELSLSPQEIPLDVLFEDRHLIAINKPSGMVVHPAPGHPDQTFVNALLFHCSSVQGMDPLRPGIVHRIDKDTSGILLAAKTVDAHRALVQLFSQRKIEKKYVAVCVGCPPEGLIDLPIRRHPTRRKEMAVCLEGKEAKSAVRILERKGPLSVVEVDLLTGRTHQIRVHLKHVGSPILGDPLYGSSSANKKYDVARQLLHAHFMRFLHPLEKQIIELSAPFPTDFSDYLNIPSN